MAWNTTERTGGTDRENDLEHTVLHGLPDGWTGEYFGSIRSTQDVAREAAKAGCGDRRIIVADVQTAGRGRQGRSWIARSGTSLTLSIVFRDQTPVPQPLRFTMLVSVALAEALEQVASPCQPRIKWPNDLMLGGMKAAGVLAESFSSARDHVVIVGCGLNVNEDLAYLAAMSPIATSVSAHIGRTVSRGKILRNFLLRIDALQAVPAPTILLSWEGRLWGVGQRVRLRGVGNDPALEVEAIVQGIEPDGRLRVIFPDGRVVRSATAEIIL